MKQLTVKDLYDFAQSHKGKTAFCGYDDHRVLTEIAESVNAGSFYYTTDNDNNICGMLLATIDHASKDIHVNENLAMNIKTLHEYAKRARIDYPGYTLRWRKHGKPKKYNTDKIYEKLAK